MKESINNWYRNTIRNPKYRWWIVLGSLLYLISPIDISPDFIPVIGWIDDGVIATILVAELSGIVLERLRTLKGKNGETVVADASGTVPSAGSETVDVNAVPLK